MSEVKGNKRVLVSIVLGIVLVISAVGGYIVYSKNASKEEGKTNVAIASEKTDYLPGTSDSKEYNKLEEEKNRKELDKALETGESNVPSLSNNIGSTKKSADIFEELEKPAVKEDKKVEPEVRVETKVVEKIVYRDSPPKVIEKVVVKPVAMQPQVQQNTEEEDKISAEEAKELDKAFAELKGKLNQNTVVSYQVPQVHQVNQANQNQQATSQPQSTASNQKSSVVKVRAGTMMSGEIITAIDTDTLGTVVAEITTGPLAGARLLGTVTNAPTNVTDYVQKVKIEFTKIAMVGESRTYEIKAAVLDDETNLPAVADDVNNHYFYRFGLKAVASFVEGFGDAFQSAGSSTSTSVFGTQTTTNTSDFDSRTAAKKALGKVGSTFGQELSKLSDRPATIYVNNGKAITILFEADF